MLPNRVPIATDDEQRLVLDIGRMRALEAAAAIGASKERLRHLALHDPLPGLPNRTCFDERLGAMIESVRTTGRTRRGALDRPRSLQDEARHRNPLRINELVDFGFPVTTSGTTPKSAVCVPV